MTSQSLLLVSRFCTPPEVKFHVFGTSKHGEPKSLPKGFFAIVISTLWRRYRANKEKKPVIYTLIQCKSPAQAPFGLVKRKPFPGKPAENENKTAVINFCFPRKTEVDFKFVGLVPS